MSGSYNGEYHDFDVYVHSNQPDDKATVTDAGGASASYYTDCDDVQDDILFRSGFSEALAVVVDRFVSA